MDKTYIAVVIYKVNVKYILDHRLWMPRYLKNKKKVVVKIGKAKKKNGKNKQTKKRACAEASKFTFFFFFQRESDRISAKVGRGNQNTRVVVDWERPNWYKDRGRPVDCLISIVEELLSDPTTNKGVKFRTSAYDKIAQNAFHLVSFLAFRFFFYLLFWLTFFLFYDCRGRQRVGLNAMLGRRKKWLKID